MTTPRWSCPLPRILARMLSRIHDLDTHEVVPKRWSFEPSADKRSLSVLTMRGTVVCRIDTDLPAPPAPMLVGGPAFPGVMALAAEADHTIALIEDGAYGPVKQFEIDGPDGNYRIPLVEGTLPPARREPDLSAAPESPVETWTVDAATVAGIVPMDRGDALGAVAVRVSADGHTVMGTDGKTMLARGRGPMSFDGAIAIDIESWKQVDRFLDLLPAKTMVRHAAGPTSLAWTAVVEGIRLTVVCMPSDRRLPYGPVSQVLVRIGAGGMPDAATPHAMVEADALRGKCRHVARAVDAASVVIAAMGSRIEITAGSVMGPIVDAGGARSWVECDATALGSMRIRIPARAIAPVLAGAGKLVALRSLSVGGGEALVVNARADDGLWHAALAMRLAQP